MGALALVVIGVALVVATAFIIDGRATTPTAGDFGSLQAPVLSADQDRATWATSVRDALDQFETGPIPTDRGGFRNSGRGWVSRGGEPGYTGSISAALMSSGLLVDSAPIDDDGNLAVALVHQCGDRFGVFIASSVLPSEADKTWWAENECGTIPDWILGEPLFFVLGAVDA